jgi:hypothetical protein
MGNVPTYRLRDDLSFCRVEGHLVFLDIENDQYFRLPRARELAFLAYVESGTCEGANLRELVEHNVLTAQPPIALRTPSTDMQRPTQSALEVTLPKKKATVNALLGVFSAVCSTHWLLRKRSLKAVLESLVAYRSARTSRPLPPSGEQLTATAATFGRLRLWVPIDTCCLLDSIALVRFLARRRLYANIVFGVTGDPFSAHCWVQVGELVLNDTVGDVNVYTSIRTV